MAERHEGFRQWAKQAPIGWLTSARRRFQQLIAEHAAMLDESLAAADPKPIRHLEVELRAFREELAIIEEELRARGAL